MNQYIITIAFLFLFSSYINAQTDNVTRKRSQHTQGAATSGKTKANSSARNNADKKRVTYTTKPVGGSVGVAVDLGLPSGTLWADRNVGASSPEDYGEYFAWGEVNPKSNYTWSTYKYSKDSKGDKFSKYVASGKYGNVDNRTTLEPQDDAAYVNWGSSWRMPTIEQLQELEDEDYTTWTCTTKNDVNGYEVKSKRNGNSIFLPASGYPDAFSLSHVGSYGYYWSSSLYASYSNYAYFLYFSSSNYDWSDGYRNYGFSVRPVRAQK